MNHVEREKCDYYSYLDYYLNWKREYYVLRSGYKGRMTTWIREVGVVGIRWMIVVFWCLLLVLSLLFGGN